MAQEDVQRRKPARVTAADVAYLKEHFPPDLVERALAAGRLELIELIDEKQVDEHVNKNGN